METAKRDVLLGTLTWWGFHGLLIWVGAEHFWNAQATDGRISASDLLHAILIGACLLSLLRLSVGRVLLRFLALVGTVLVLYQVLQGTAQWIDLSKIALWAYTYFSFGPMSWRHALYTPLGVFGKLKA